MIPPPVDRSDKMSESGTGCCGRGGWKRVVTVHRIRRASAGPQELWSIVRTGGHSQVVG